MTLKAMILKNYRSAIPWAILVIILFDTTAAKAQRDCYSIPKTLAPYLEEMLKGTSNNFFTPRVTHDYVLSLTQKLPEDAEEKEALLKERYFKYLEDTDADLTTLRNTFRTKGIVPGNMRIVGAVSSESQIVQSNRPKGFAAPLPKEEQVHLEITSTLFVVDNNTGNYSNRMLINAYILENNGYFSLMKIDSNPVSDLSKQANLINNFRVKFPELLSYTYLADDNFRNIHYPGKALARIQVNGEESTTVSKISDEEVSGLFAYPTSVKIHLAEGITKTQLPKAINEMQGALSLHGKGVGYGMKMSGLINKESTTSFTYDFISKSAFRKEGEQLIKYYRICYREKDYSQKSMPARLIISPDDNANYRVDLIVGKKE